MPLSARRCRRVWTCDYQRMGVRGPDIRCDWCAVLPSVGRRSAERLDTGGHGIDAGGMLIRRISSAKSGTRLQSQRARLRSNRGNRDPVRTEYVNPQYSITTARPQDLAQLPAIGTGSCAAPRGACTGVRPERDDGLGRSAEGSEAGAPLGGVAERCGSRLCAR